MHRAPDLPTGNRPLSKPVRPSDTTTKHKKRLQEWSLSSKKHPDRQQHGSLVKREGEGEISLNSKSRSRASLKPNKVSEESLNDIEELDSLSPSPKLVHERLRESGLVYNPPDQKKPQQPVLDSLFGTILSQATNRANSTRAFAELKRRYPSDWGDAFRAGPDAIEDAIRCGGLANRKAIRIHKILSQIHLERQSFSLEHLREMDDEDVITELTKYDGVGPKTAACVCMFSLGRAEMPVDTHVNRIASRLGWTPMGTSPESTYKLLNEKVPDHIKYSLHIQLVEHGRRTCHARNPKCADCPLRDICISSKDVSKEAIDGSQHAVTEPHPR